MKTGAAEKIAIALGTLVSVGVTGAVIVSFALFLMILASQLLVLPAFGQSKPSVELEGVIAKEQVDGDLKAARASYQRIASDTSAPREVRAKALMHLAGCYEKLGQQAQKVYEQIVHDFGDQPVAAQARVRLARYSKEIPPPRSLKLERLTANTTELPIQTAAISPDGKFVAYSDPSGIHIRSSTTGETRLMPETQDHRVVQWMPDGKTIETSVVDAGGRIETAIVSLSGGTPIRGAAVLDGFVSSPDRARRVTLSSDKRRLSIQDSNGQNPRELWKAFGNSTLDHFWWSPTSKQIAIASSTRDTHNNPTCKLELVEIASGKEKVLSPSENTNEVSSLVWVSSNHLMMIIDEDVAGVNQYNSNLWELRLADGGDVLPGGFRRLTTWTDFPVKAGSLSTDGKSLVFIRSFRQRDVYVAGIEPGNTHLGIPKRLTFDLGDDYPSDWTHDNKAIILTSDRSGTQGIYRQDLDKLTAERIVIMPGHQLLARVTPDGRAVLFLNTDPAKNPYSQLMRVPIEGGTANLLPNTEHVGFYYRCPLAGVCLMAQKEGEVYVVSELDTVSGKGREIYRDRHIEHLDVSPDGKWISETSGQGAGTKFIIRSFSTGAVVQEVPLAGATNLVSSNWAPDGRGIFWGDLTLTEAREMFVDLQGNSTVLLRQSGDFNSIWGHPSPDGKELALLLTTDDSNVYMIKNF